MTERGSEELSQVFWRIVSRLSVRPTLHFSYYKDDGGSEEGRRVVEAPGDFLQDEGAFRRLFDDLREYEELAVHSNVEFSDVGVRHVPMVDLAEDAGVDECQKLVRHLGQEYRCGWYFFDSGHSFHAYGDKLLTRVEWREFCGQILLANSKGLADIVDSRWVGHRLRGGYFSLRWSNNTDKHTQKPQFVERRFS